MPGDSPMPGLAIPSIPDPHSRTRPLTDAYGHIAGLGIDIPAAAGRMVLNIHPSHDDAGEPPVTQVTLSLGQELVPAVPENAEGPARQAVRVATLAELMGESDFASAYGVIAARLYRECLKHPLLAGSTIVS